MLDHDRCLADTALADDDRKPVRQWVVAQKVPLEIAVADSQESLAQGNKVIEHCITPDSI